MRLINSSRRRRLLAQPFPDQWEKLLQKNIAIYKYLPKKLKKELHGLIQVFLDEKHFEGCAGLKINNEIKVTISAQACILLLNKKNKYYPRLLTILVYPHSYKKNRKQYINGSVVVEEDFTAAGESWDRGVVVLAWDHVKKGASDCFDGNNVVFHEFAHQLDQEDGRSDGTPFLSSKNGYIAWANVMNEEFLSVRRKVEKGMKDIIDDYGATNSAEFFAVATEIYFERPKELKEKHLKLYNILKKFYKMDPVKWIS